jgi:hypothetical protein
VAESVLEFIAERTDAYAYKDWVVPSPRLDRDGNHTKRPIYKPVFTEHGRPLPNNARHRCKVSEGERKLEVDKYFVLAWFGCLMMVAGAFFGGDNNRGIDAIYADPEYGLSIPYIQNTMPKRAFKFMRNYIHFSKTREQKRKGEPGYDPLFKVRSVL